MPRSLTVDAVIIRNGKILLIRRKNDPFQGCFALPGGYVEKDEDAKGAVIREVEEETGLVVRPLRMSGVYDSPGRDKRGNVSIAFLCEIVRGEPRPGHDSSGVEFFRTDSLPGLAFDHEKIIRDAIGPSRKKRVLVGGVFNIIHPGHRYFLEMAKGLGDELVVVVANDKTVLRDKKKLMFPARVRAGTVESVGAVDRAVVGDELDMTKVIRRERPDVIAVGYDQDEETIRSLVKKSGIKCKVVRLDQLKGYSTKKITGE